MVRQHARNTTACLVAHDKEVVKGCDSALTESRRVSLVCVQQASCRPVPRKA